MSTQEWLSVNLYDSVHSNRLHVTCLLGFQDDVMVLTRLIADHLHWLPSSHSIFLDELAVPSFLGFFFRCVITSISAKQTCYKQSLRGLRFTSVVFELNIQRNINIFIPLNIVLLGQLVKFSKSVMEAAEDEKTGTAQAQEGIYNHILILWLWLS